MRRWWHRFEQGIIERLPDAIWHMLAGQASESLEYLEPGRKKEKQVEAFILWKVRVLIAGGLIGTALLIIYLLPGHVSVPGGNLLHRQQAGGESYEVYLEADVAGAGKQQITYTVEPRNYTMPEQEAVVSEIKEYLREVVIGENDSPDRICKPLFLPDHYADEPFTVEWEMADYNLIGADGTLEDVASYDLPVDTIVTAVITYGDQLWRYDIELTVTGKEEELTISDILMNALYKADTESSNTENLVLPEQIEGRGIHWAYQKSRTLLMLGAGAFVISLMLTLLKDQRLKDQIQERETLLECAYPDFVHQMVLMLGAGMTVRRSIEQIAQNGRRDSPLNKELRYAIYQMQSGVPEIRVYRHLANRTGLSEYIRFSQLLTQYLRKGSRGMQQMMMQEMTEAQKHRRDLAKRAGEMAGAKLLGPMIILLVVVLGVIMAPALMNL